MRSVHTTFEKFSVAPYLNYPPSGPLGTDKFCQQQFGNEMTIVACFVPLWRLQFVLCAFIKYARLSATFVESCNAAIHIYMETLTRSLDLST